MEAIARAPGAEQHETPPWNLRWLTPRRCRFILLSLVLLGFFNHLHYLRNNCPIDLSGDEAQYWDWSRQLDWSYYSKGPAVAYIIRTSTELFGNQMWAVRLPALLLAAGSTLLTYWLTLRLFGSDRLALGAVLLNHLVPMFVAGSMLMTIDPPYFFCWGLATCFFVAAIVGNKRWAWIAAGIAVGLGVLAKYGMLIWPVGMFVFLLVDARSRHWLRTPWPYSTVLIALLFLTPPIVWNVQHDWVTFRHVARQTGATAQHRFFNGNFVEFIGSQIAVVGPALAPILIGAAISAWRRQRLVAQSDSAPAADADRGVVLLLWMGLPIFAMCVIGSLRSKMQVNWPAAAYFSWMILAAWFIATRMASARSWRRWRGWVWGAILFGVVMMPIAHDFERLYWAMPVLNQFRKKPIEAREFDPTAKLKGWKELGQRIASESTGLNAPFILCEDYMQTAETAFYVPGSPKTFCVGAYITNPKDRKRHTQYDVWPDRRLSNPQMLGRDAIYVGYINPDVIAAFEKVEPLPEEPIFRRGQKVRRFLLHRCIGFKGMTLQSGGGDY